MPDQPNPELVSLMVDAVARAAHAHADEIIAAELSRQGLTPTETERLYLSMGVDAGMAAMSATLDRFGMLVKA